MENKNCQINLKYSWTGSSIFNTLSSKLQSQGTTLQRVRPGHFTLAFQNWPRREEAQHRSQNLWEKPRCPLPGAAPSPRSSLVRSHLALCSNLTGLFDGSSLAKNIPAQGLCTCPSHLSSPYPCFLSPFICWNVTSSERPLTTLPQTACLVPPCYLTVLFFPSETDEVSLCLWTSSPL